MLDVLITISDTTPPAWVNQCRRSVVEAARLAGFAVTVIEVPGVPGHIGQAMADGFVRSTAPYVAWVDDDDYVLPNAFRCIGEHLEDRPEAICAREIHILANGHIVPCMPRHHLTAWRRDLLERIPFDEIAAYPLVPLLKAVELTAVDEMSWVYMRRIRESEGMKLRRAHASASI